MKSLLLSSNRLDTRCLKSSTLSLVCGRRDSVCLKYINRLVRSWVWFESQEALQVHHDLQPWNLRPLVSLGLFIRRGLRVPQRLQNIRKSKSISEPFLFFLRLGGHGEATVTVVWIGTAAKCLQLLKDIGVFNKILAPIPKAELLDSPRITRSYNRHLQKRSANPW